MSKATDDTEGPWVILPVSMPSLPSYPKPTTHHIYLQPDRPRIPSPDDTRRLFLVNCPVDSTNVHFRAIFTSLVGAGRFESINFTHEQRTGGPGLQVMPEVAQQTMTVRKRKRGTVQEEERDTNLPQTWDRPLYRSGSTAVVTLVDEKSVQAVIKATRKLHRGSKTKLVWGAGIHGTLPALGSDRYKSHHALRYPNSKALQDSIDAFMTKFNSREEVAARQAKRARDVPDEDGFVTVSRGGRTGPARKEEAETKRKEMEVKEEKKRRELEKTGFYRWQGRERRKREEIDLRKRFEEDKRRMMGLKEQRRKLRPEE